jgi:hypothetical protein
MPHGSDERRSRCRAATRVKREMNHGGDEMMFGAHAMVYCGHDTLNFGDERMLGRGARHLLDAGDGCAAQLTIPHDSLAFD